MKYKGNDNVAIVKIDSDANEIDVPGVSVKGFPTIYFFKGDDKVRHKYVILLNFIFTSNCIENVFYFISR